MLSLSPLLRICIVTLCSLLIAPVPAYVSQDETFQLADGFQIQRIAAEPLIADPVAMDVDETGTVYVVEMPGYPLDVDGQGRVKILRDTDSDGVLDTSTLFAEGIVLPTGIMRWKDGIIVTAPPDVIFLKDTDGDDKADHREVILTGFARSNPQHNFNSPKYGLDNWIYVANNGIIWTSAYKDQFGDTGSAVHFPARPDGAKLGQNGNNRNVRFKPDSYAVESLSGRSQFGHTFDAWGHHFNVSNAHPQFHEVIAARYIDRSPMLTARMAMNYTPEYGRNTSIYPITQSPQHQLLTDRGMITSAAGITYYLGGLFPTSYQNTTFVGEPVHNLVHALTVEEDGPTFSSQRIEQRKEFLASTDSWFRPVNFYVGPDGALYVIDYYRELVEHPEWMDEATAASDRLQNGNTQGRIYRVTPTGTAPASWMNNLALDAAPNDTLVSYLASSNIWWRQTAQRLLVDRKATDAVPMLTRLLSESTPEGRLHALWTIEGLGGLTAAHVGTALNDPHPGVRENGIILSERFLHSETELQQALYALADESHPRVRFQLLCTLGYVDSEESGDIRDRLLMENLDNEWMQLASLSTVSAVDLDYLSTMAPALIAHQTEGRALFLERISMFIASQGTASDIDQLYTRFLGSNAEVPEWAQASMMQGMTDGLQRNRTVAAQLIGFRDALLRDFYTSSSIDVRTQLLALLSTLPQGREPAVQAAIKTSRIAARNEGQAPQSRALDIGLLAFYAPDTHSNLFSALIAAKEPIDVQLASVKALGTTKDPYVADTLLSRWNSMTTPVRNAVLDELMADRDRIQALLTGVEEGTIQPSAIGWDRTVRLMRDTEGELKARARALLSEPPGVREEVVASYTASLGNEGDIQAGQVVFSQVCSTCHQVAGLGGVAFGPDLGTVRHWSPEALVASILIPQRTITDGFGLWSVGMNDGSTLTGLIAAESPTEISLRQLGQPDRAIPRSAISSLTSLNASAMPDGLEAQLTKEEMTDLIAYLRFN